jgi:hypothetical protein
VLAQRRHLDGHDAQAVEEVGPEAAGRHARGERLVADRDDARVGVPRPRLAHDLELAALEHLQQLGLHLGPQRADLVEHERAALGLREAPGARGRGARNGALAVPEELALEQRLGHGRAVHAHEVAARARPGAVDLVGHELLARAALAGDEHRGVAARDLADRLAQPSHRGAVAHQALGGVAIVGRAAQVGHVGEQPPVLERALDLEQELARVDRLLQEVEGAGLHRGHRARDRAHAGDHDHGQARGLPSDLVEQRQAAAVRHLQVGEHEVDRLGGEQLARRARVLGRHDAQPLARQHVLQRLAHEGLVVDDEHGVSDGHVDVSWLCSAGSRIVKRAPRGLRLAAVSVPPCACTMP